MVDSAAAKQSDKRCIACCEPIRQGAKMCPYCRTSQKPQRWKIAGTVLKWIGGITAVLSLLIGAVRVDEIYDNWREGNEAVEELVAASHLQLKARDYAGGWNLLQQALELRPTSSKARSSQVDLAMAWIRDVRRPEGGRFSDSVDRLLPVLYRGTSSGKAEYIADVFSHIGWGNYLKYRDDGRLYTIEEFYQQSLQLDPDNTFAHMFLGHWLLNGPGRGEDSEQLPDAVSHYSAAVQTGREQGYVTNFVLRTLLEWRTPASLEHAIRIANTIRQMDQSVDQETAREMIQSIWQPRPYRYFSEDELMELLKALPANDLLLTYRWLLDSSDMQNEHVGYRYVIARLMEVSGNKSGALEMYRSLQADATSNQILGEALAAALSRLNQ